MNTTKRFEELLAHLKQQGNRLTPQRVAIIRAIINHDGHPSAEQIHKEIIPDFPTTSLATVYKTLNLLKKSGEVLELGFGDDGSRYDGRKPIPHPHMICTKCGTIKDTDLKDFDTLVEKLARQTGFSVQNHRFDIFGLCPACRK